MPKDFYHPKLNDSKQITAADRAKLRVVVEREALAWAVATATEAEIDKINILHASILAMHRAVEKLQGLVPEHLLVDGNRFKLFPNIPHTCVIKGDAIYAPIAAASILAKTYRDEYMDNLHQQFPEYNWLSNKGYPSKAHRAAIKEFGATVHHRRSFRLLPDAELFD